MAKVDTTESMGKYEYFLCFWGQIENDNLVEKELGIKENNFWFNTKEERNEFKERLKSIANKYNVIIAFNEEEGNHVRYKTIARMVMVFPNGKEYPYEYDFGYAYNPDSARYIFEEGNYSCDCNKTIFLSEKFPEIQESECGDNIIIKNFEVLRIKV